MKSEYDLHIHSAYSDGDYDIPSLLKILKKNNINVTIRREFGSKINAACGQLKTVKENLA